MPEIGILPLMRWLTVDGIDKSLTEQIDSYKECELFKHKEEEDVMWPYTEEEVKWLSGR